MWKWGCTSEEHVHGSISQAPGVLELGDFIFHIYLSKPSICCPWANHPNVSTPPRRRDVVLLLCVTPQLLDYGIKRPVFLRCRSQDRLPFSQSRSPAKHKFSGVGGGDWSSTDYMNNDRVMRKSSTSWLSVPITKAWTMAWCAELVLCVLCESEQFLTFHLGYRREIV